MSKTLLELAADIVKSQAANNILSADDVELTLTRTFNLLQRMQRAENELKPLEAAISPEGLATGKEALEKMDPAQSIQENKVICLECGAEFRQLTANHLSIHGLTIRDYKKKWGFRMKQSLGAKALSKFRSKAAKKRGLPENLVRYRAEQRQKKEQLAAVESPLETISPQPPVRETAKRRRTPKSP